MVLEYLPVRACRICECVVIPSTSFILVIIQDEVPFNHFDKVLRKICQCFKKIVFIDFTPFLLTKTIQKYKSLIVVQNLVPNSPSIFTRLERYVAKRLLIDITTDRHTEWLERWKCGIMFILDISNNVWYKDCSFWNTWKID